MKAEDIFGSEETISEAGLNGSATSLVPAGAVLLVVRSGILKHTIPVAINSVPVTLNQDMKAIRLNADVCTPAYLKRLIEGNNEMFLHLWSKQGATVESIEQDYLGATILPLPPLSEQSAIAAFLDHETAKIDALVAEQDRLIALLKEKRQAVISHAVTKGLDPNAAMKDSGVEWLGQVPAHWELRRLKNLSPFITVGIVVNPSSYLADEGYPFIYGGDIREGVIDWQNARRISHASTIVNSKTRIQAGDLLTVRVGAPGVTAVVPPECEGGNCASVMLIRKGPYDSRWLCYAMNTRIVRFQVEIVQYGAAQEQFNIAHAVNFWVPTPPKAEQAEIADFLDRECDRVGLLTIEAENTIALLRERRAALISAAVTGKIDVRGFASPRASAT